MNISINEENDKLTYIIGLIVALNVQRAVFQLYSGEQFQQYKYYIGLREGQQYMMATVKVWVGQQI